MFIATSKPKQELIHQVLTVVEHACEILMTEYEKYCSGMDFVIDAKSDQSPVTQADIKLDHLFNEKLAQIVDVPILSEEGEFENRQQWSRFWLLDPLDGTKQFLKKTGEFTINLSLINQGESEFALIALPAKSVCYLVYKNNLPYKYQIDEKKWSIYTPTSHKNNPIRIGLSSSSQKREHYLQYLNELSTFSQYEVVYSGSASKFCFMLEDEIDFYPRFHPTCEWDTHAGQALLESIGGGLIDFQEKSFSYNQRSTLLNKGFIAYKDQQSKKIALQALKLMENKA